MISERLCTSCSAVINGRPDKKFCCDLCRSQFNYKRRKDEIKDSFDYVDRILKNNREILSLLYSRRKKRVSRVLLISKGFNFEYFTNIRSTEMQHLYFSCYDIGYSIINDHEVALIKP